MTTAALRLRPPQPEDIFMSEQAVQDWIRKQVAANDVVLFMKGNKGMPQCGFSSQVDQILRYLDVDYKDINVLEDMGIREGIKAFSNWPTIPQLYIKGEFVGGCDIVREMFQAGELQQELQDKGVPFDHSKAKMTA
jgi:monothiol glutaredoxin